MNHWNLWSRSDERGRLIAFTDCGSQVGKIIGFSLGMINEVLIKTYLINIKI